MGTYDHNQVMSDYEHGRITVEMALGHSLQHIAKLYEALKAVNADRRAEQVKLDALEKHVNTQQTALDRLLTLVGKALAKRKQNSPKSD